MEKETTKMEQKKEKMTEMINTMEGKMGEFVNDSICPTP
jgi:hypothetical protein